MCAFVTPANWDDQNVALAHRAVDGGTPLADLGYRAATELAPLLWDELDLLLVTRAHAGHEQRALFSTGQQRSGAH